jgi:hypothetical protein
MIAFFFPPAACLALGVLAAIVALAAWTAGERESFHGLVTAPLVAVLLLLSAFGGGVELG